jgi:hypothetical protein
MPDHQALNAEPDNGKSPLVSTDKQEEQRMKADRVSGDRIDTSVRDASNSENSPLLGDTGSDQSEHGQGDEEWPGESDFAGLPWWRVPSVCCNTAPFHTVYGRIRASVADSTIDILAPA